MKYALLVLIYSSFIFANTPTKLEVEGNSRTHTRVIESEIHDLLINQELTKDELVEIKRRLWNLRIFSHIEIVSAKKTCLNKVERKMDDHPNY